MRARIAPISGTGLDVTLAPAAASRFNAVSRLAATAGSTSSIPVLSGTTNSTPRRPEGLREAAGRPRSAMSISAQSSTVRAMGPIVSRVRESGNTPRLSIRPSLVLNPTMPQKPAGARIEPPVSLPIAQGARPPATATAAPDEDPPAMRGVTGSRGFLGVPKCGLSPRAEKANSERLVLPSAAIPAAARLATIGASFSFTGAFA